MNEMPRTFDVTGLRAAGFQGFETVASLRGNRLASVPTERGVYLLLRASPLAPRFLAESTGGWFKGLDPSDSIHALKSKWVKGATVVYIGKVGTETGAATLRSRLRQLLDFGSGKAVGHRGGRFPLASFRRRQAARLLAHVATPA